MRESESVSTESAGPVSTHLELLSAGGHPSVGGPGVLGSADSLLVGVSTLGYPSEYADPIDSAIGGEFASTSLVSAAEAMTTSETTTPQQATSRQPPTATEVTAAASRSPTLTPSVVDTPTRGRRRSSAYTLSPPTLSPAYAIEQSQSVPVRIGRAASSQRRSQRPPSLSPTQWTGSYGSPSPPIGSDIETDYPAARPSVYQPRSTEASQAPLQVGADIYRPGSTVDPRVRIPAMSTFVSLAAEVQPDNLHVAPTHTHMRSDNPIPSSDIGQRSVKPMRIDVAHPHASPSTTTDILELASLPITVAARHQPPAIVSRSSTVDVRKPMPPMGRRQSKSSVPIGINYCKKLNSLKHLVRTTLIESHK